jgi:hypothetical protein
VGKGGIAAVASRRSDETVGPRSGAGRGEEARGRNSKERNE